MEIFGQFKMGQALSIRSSTPYPAILTGYLSYFPNNAHRALDDVLVLYQVFQLMIDDLEIEEVYTLLNRQTVINHMPFGKHQGQPLSQIPRNYVQWLASNGVFEKPENKELKESF